MGLLVGCFDKIFIVSYGLLVACLSGFGKSCSDYAIHLPFNGSGFEPSN